MARQKRVAIDLATLPDDALLGRNDIADGLGMPRATLTAWIHRGVLPASEFRTPAGQQYWLASTIRSWDPPPPNRSGRPPGPPKPPKPPKEPKVKIPKPPKEPKVKIPKPPKPPKVKIPKEPKPPKAPKPPKPPKETKAKVKVEKPPKPRGRPKTPPKPKEKAWEPEPPTPDPIRYAAPKPIEDMRWIESEGRRFITVDRIAGLCGLRLDAVREMIQSGRIPPTNASEIVRDGVVRMYSEGAALKVYEILSKIECDTLT